MAAGRLLLALMATLVAATCAGSRTVSDKSEELPVAAAHKQIVYRYIPIDKAFLGLDKSYDDYYGTSKPSTDYRRSDHGFSSYNDWPSNYNSPSGSGFSGHRREDDYYNYRRDDDYHRGHDDHRAGYRNDADTYSTYSDSNRRHHDTDHTHRNTHQEYYDYDYTQDYSPPTRRPARRRKKKVNRNDKWPMLDFAEAVVKRIFPRKSTRSGGGGHRGSRFKFPKFITFDAVVTFLSYMVGVGLVIAYVVLVALNAVASDGASIATIIGRSLDRGDSQLIDEEALKVLVLLENAIQRHERGCVRYRLCQISRGTAWEALTSAASWAFSGTAAADGPDARRLTAARPADSLCDEAFPQCAPQQRPAARLDTP
ncbi:uncharacterized protein LOC119112277 [Pollicipes pollicipes]|uniref:uncharacterized protein LOC119112277 n=1 Tax=Pollicipes pollicipes TaxID=41117 RepID=UPI001884A10E|nr:uncharacterized protein LOC119112277 [Pollicipes pollicipes]